LFWNSSLDLTHLSNTFSIFFVHQNNEPDHVQILPPPDKTPATNSARTRAPPPSLLCHQTRLVLLNLLVRSLLPRSLLLADLLHAQSTPARSSNSSRPSPLLQEALEIVDHTFELTVIS
jgi:hypothetical protein